MFPKNLRKRKARKDLIFDSDTNELNERFIYKKKHLTNVQQINMNPVKGKQDLYFV